MEIFKLRYKDKLYMVKGTSLRDASSKLMQKVGDERLSPMTYAKLKEMGYSSDDWKNLTQEKANDLVSKGKKEEPKKAEKKEEPKKTNYGNMYKDIFKLYELKNSNNEKAYKSNLKVEERDKIIKQNKEEYSKLFKEVSEKITRRVMNSDKPEAGQIQDLIWDLEKEWDQKTYDRLKVLLNRLDR